MFSPRAVSSQTWPVGFYSRWAIFSGIPMLHHGALIDGPCNVRPRAAGEVFIAAGELVPDWFGGKFEFAPADVLICVGIDGLAVMRVSRGAAEHH